MSMDLFYCASELDKERTWTPNQSKILGSGSFGTIYETLEDSQCVFKIIPCENEDVEYTHFTTEVRQEVLSANVQQRKLALPIRKAWFNDSETEAYIIMEKTDKSLTQMVLENLMDPAQIAEWTREAITLSRQGRI